MFVLSFLFFSSLPFSFFFSHLLSTIFSFLKVFMLCYKNAYIPIKFQDEKFRVSVNRTYQNYSFHHGALLFLTLSLSFTDSEHQQDSVSPFKFCQLNILCLFRCSCRPNSHFIFLLPLKRTLHSDKIRHYWRSHNSTIRYKYHLSFFYISSSFSAIFRLMSPQNWKFLGWIWIITL